MEQTKDIFGKRLLEIRESRGESQQELADSIGITRQSLSRYELGERTANIDLLKKVAEHYNVSADYLLGLTDNKTTDIDLQAVCKYTGLYENAVKFLKFQNDNIKIQIIKKTMSDFIASDYFWTIVSFVSELEQNTLQWKNEVETNIKKELKNDKNISYDKIADIGYVCDMKRYLIVESINRFVDFYDWRLDDAHRMPFDEENRIEQIREQIIKEASDNGKHNPPEE